MGVDFCSLEPTPEEANHILILGTAFHPSLLEEEKGLSTSAPSFWPQELALAWSTRAGFQEESLCIYKEISFGVCLCKELISVGSIEHNGFRKYCYTAVSREGN
jgi:hypothetical protein